jgi:DNA invertase Pin-like site-specific DNA recombinase
MMDIDINGLSLNNSVIDSTVDKSIIYTRVSTQEQMFNRQITKCSEFCNQNNFKITNIVSESCSAYKNPLQLELLKIINDNSNINLIIEETDRFSRNVNYGVKLLDKCFEKNIIIYILNKNYIVKNKKSADYIKLINDIKEAENDSIKKSERIKFANNLKKPNPQIIFLILKLYYGSNKQNIENILLKITGCNTITEFDEIILYGYYDVNDIVFILNENKILNNKKIWTKSAINNIIKNNTSHKENIEKLTNELLIEIYAGLTSVPDYDKIFTLLTKIHNYNMSDAIVTLKNILTKPGVSKKNIWDKFLNVYRINFRIWNYETEINKYGYHNI